MEGACCSANRFRTYHDHSHWFCASTSLYTVGSAEYHTGIPFSINIFSSLNLPDGSFAYPFSYIFIDVLY